MKTINVDVAIIGVGTAGLAAYRNAKKYASKVVTIEGGKYGTTCARVGCMPSKLLIAAAESVHDIKKLDKFGINILGEIKIDGKKVMERVKNERDRFVGFVLESVDNIPEEDKIKGFAKFIDNNTLQVDEHTIIKAKSIVISSGSSTSVPQNFRDLGKNLIINDDIFEWDDLPDSVAVFGAGIIGLELAQALNFLGVRTKIFGRNDSLAQISDPKVKEYAKKVISDEIYLDTNAEVIKIEKVNDKVRIKYKNLDGNIVEEDFDYLLSATGRTPNLKNLALENTDLKIKENGIPVFDRYTMQCGESNIFIAGDSNNGIPLLHEAADEGEIAGINAGNYPNISKQKRRSKIGIVFSNPQIAFVGNSYAELEDKNIVIGEVSFENQGRSRVMLKNKGILRVYADAETGTFLGAEMIGPAAEHIGHLLAWSHQQKMTIPQMLEMPFYHPVIEEGLRTALRDANKNLNI